MTVNSVRGIIQGVSSGTTGLFLTFVDSAPNVRGAGLLTVTVVENEIVPSRIDPIVAALRLRDDPDGQSESRLGQTGVVLEVLSGLFYLQERAEVTVSVVLQNGRRIVVDDPTELDIQSSNDSIVSVDGNFIVAEEVGTVNLNVSWVVCGMILSKRIVEVTVAFAQNRPIFDNKTQIAEVLESAEMGTLITTVRAIDFDFVNTNAIPDTEYRFADESHSHGGLFDLDEITGQLRLNGPLDRESQDRYVIVIEATDRDQRQAEQAASERPTTGSKQACPGGSGVGGDFTSGDGSGSGDCDNGMLTPDDNNQTSQFDPPDQITVSEMDRKQKNHAPYLHNYGIGHISSNTHVQYTIIITYLMCLLHYSLGECLCLTVKSSCVHYMHFTLSNVQGPKSLNVRKG